MSYRFRNRVDDFYWIFMGIYGPTKGKLGKSYGRIWRLLEVCGEAHGA